MTLVTIPSHLLTYSFDDFQSDFHYPASSFLSSFPTIVHKNWQYAKPSGEMLGPDQPVILHLLEIPPAKQALEGVVMELEDCAFPLLQGAFTVLSLLSYLTDCADVNGQRVAFSPARFTCVVSFVSILNEAWNLAYACNSWSILTLTFYLAQ